MSPAPRWILVVSCCSAALIYSLACEPCSLVPAPCGDVSPDDWLLPAPASLYQSRLLMLVAHWLPSGQNSGECLPFPLSPFCFEKKREITGIPVSVSGYLGVSTRVANQSDKENVMMHISHAIGINVVCGSHRCAGCPCGPRTCAS